jgi:hypothetical protein
MQDKATTNPAEINSLSQKNDHKCINNPKCADCVAESRSTIDRYNKAYPDHLINVGLSPKQVCFLSALMDETDPEELVNSLDLIFETACFLSNTDWSKDGVDSLYDIYKLLNNLRLLV